ncbi:MAG: phosphoglycerate kinase, partial [Planctomycetes bacterium]|nr:phosphoglycerate kinase [Planctomycetota bacterium]
MSPGDLPALASLPREARRVLVRVDYNVPLDGERVTDATRIVRTRPTLDVLRRDGRSVVLASHLGRPDGKPDPRFSLKVLLGPLRSLLGVEVAWGGNAIAEAPGRCRDLKPGGVLLVENLRYHAGEEANDGAFAAALAALADAYVNEAFGASHRAHASIVGVPERLPSAAGDALREEVAQFLSLRGDPEPPFVAFLGGAKVSDKLPVLEALLPKLKTMCVGGPMAYTLLAAQGVATGASKKESGMDDTCRSLLRRCRERGVELLLPEDHVTVAKIDDPSSARVEEGPIAPGRVGVDIGPRTRARFAKAAAGAGTIFWNGPPGIFEKAPYASGTRAV